MSFQRQSFHALEDEQDRQTHTQTDATEHITTATFLGDNCIACY